MNATPELRHRQRLVAHSRQPIGQWLLVSLLLCGCNSKPQAPLLRDSPVYQNDREGFRFLVPEGWTQTANTLLPPGELEGEIFLVRYRLTTPVGGALMQVLVMQEQEPLDAAAHHAAGSFGVEQWKPLGPAETIDVNGKAAEHLRYSGTLQGAKRIKEVYVFRQGGRVYSFVGLYAPEDEFARQQIERAVKSSQWDD